MQKLTKFQFEELILNKISNESNIVQKKEITRSEILYKPEIEDLYRLYSIVIDNAVTSILEIGSGWSTLAMAMGMHYNYENFGQEYVNDRNRHAFQIHSYDSSQYFMNIALNRLNSKEVKFVIPTICKHQMSTFRDLPATYMSPIPKFDFDFIYLDAPEPEQIFNTTGLLEVNSIYDFPISADLLRNEAYLQPFTIILIDGRTANARFLAQNFYRPWMYHENQALDVSLFLLDEKPLGNINKKHIEFRKLRSITKLNFEKILNNL